MQELITGCEREVAVASDGDSDERKNESIMRLSWALVHSREKEDIQRGVAMLESTIAPDWRQALSLKKAVEDRIAKDGVIGIGITATVVGLLVGGVATALARRN
ncbi:hypothetical protein RYX36_030830 [Vicia faba]